MKYILVVPAFALAASAALRPTGTARPGAALAQHAGFQPEAALPGALQGVGIDQKLDQQIPLNLTFPDEARPRCAALQFFQPKKPVFWHWSTTAARCSAPRSSRASKAV